MPKRTKPAKAARPRGRPTDYNPAITATICERLAEGETLRQLCRDEAMPGRTTVFRWLSEHEEFRDQYARACEFRADGWADEILEIADDGSNDWMEKRNRDGEPTGDYFLNKEAVMRSKLRAEMRQWLMGKAAPKKYGDKVSLEHTGKDGGPVQTEGVIRVEFVEPGDERAREEAGDQ